jgi:hypothetical protein
MAKVETWARRVRDTEEYEEIPEDLRAIYAADTGGYTPEIFLVYCPENERQRKMMTEKLLYLYNNALIYVERTKNGIIRLQYNAPDLYVLETGFVLLDSWMTVVGLVDGKVSSTTVHFNRVVAGFFDHLVEGLRLMELGKGELENEADNAFALSLRGVSYKYMNFMRGINFKGERVLGHIFQPLIKGKFYRLFRLALTNDHLTVLTEHELILITEGAGFVDRYGHTYTFFRRDRVQDVSFSEDPQEPARVRMTVRSGGVYSRTALYGGKQCDEAKRLTAKFPVRS